MPDLLPVTLDDMIQEVKRELAMRERLYPQWKRDAGRNKRNQLDRQWDVMEAVLQHLEAERDGMAERHEAR
jgi:hypothetical protein